MGWGGCLFEAGRLLTFSAFRMGAYSRWALIRGWALIRINTVLSQFCRILKKPIRENAPKLFHTQVVQRIRKTERTKPIQMEKTLSQRTLIGRSKNAILIPRLNMVVNG